MKIKNFQNPDIKNFKSYDTSLKGGQLSLDKLKINQRSFNYLPN